MIPDEPSNLDTMRAIWATASFLERLILVVLPFTSIWDVWHGNWVDLIVGAVAFAVVVHSLKKDLNPWQN